MALRNASTLIYGIFATDSLTNLEQNDSLDILQRICRTIKEQNGVQTIPITNFLESKKDTIEFNPAYGDVLVWTSPLIFANMFDDTWNTDELVRYFVSLTHNFKETINVAIEYVKLLHDIFWGTITKEEILNILPELDILEDEVPQGLMVKDVFFTALWCFVMTDSYEQACKKASKLDHTNSYIVEVTGALSSLYYGIEDIPEDWKNSAEEKFSLNKIIF